MIEVEGYSLGDELGRGGFGTVFRATDHVHGRNVALKVLGRLDDDGARRRFDRERRAMGTLSGHPNIAVVYNSGFTADERPFIAMELLSGGSLADQLDQRGEFDPDEVIEIGVQLCNALAHAHSGGVLHLDMKPENVLFSEFGAAKVVDFGIAALVDDKRSTTIFATPAFADPQVLNGEAGTASSDVYGVAATLFNLLTGASPYASESGGLATFHKIANDPVPRIDRPGVPSMLADCLHRAMSKDAAGRPASMSDLRDELQVCRATELFGSAETAEATAPASESANVTSVPTAATELPPTAPHSVASNPTPIPTANPASSKPPAQRSNLIGVGLIGLAAIVLVGFAVVAFTGGDDSRGDAEPPASVGSEVGELPVDEPTATNGAEPVETVAEAVSQLTVAAGTTVAPTLPPRRPPRDGPSASNARFSLQTTNGLPDPEVFVVPDGSTQLCLTWSYTGFPAGAPFELEWLIDGTPDAGSRTVGTNEGGVNGEFFGCISNDVGLDAGRYELVWNVGAEQVFTHAISVGGTRVEVAIGIQNDRSGPVCDVFWSPIGSSTLGLAANPNPILPGGSFETTLASGRYRTVVRDCQGQVVFEEDDTDFSSEMTLTVVDLPDS